MKYTGLLYKNLILCHKNQSVLKNVTRSSSTGVDLFSVKSLSNSVKKDIEDYWRDKININKYNEEDSSKEKFYLLAMFPYPSGKLHMGHVRVYTISDAVARFYRMRGYNVLHPMGWDAFGLPAENAAIEKQVDPNQWTNDNIKLMRNQLNMMNYNFDWEREFATCNPEYYRWTQELFLKLFDKGLVYQKEAFVNWDPVDQTVLAEEQVDGNNCSWRSGAKVEKKLLTQWFARTTSLAKSLLEGLNDPSLKEWRDIIKIQKHWIGDCNGTSFELQLISNIPEYPKTVNVWTEMPEFIEYAKYIVISPNSLLHRKDHCQDVDVGIKVLDAKVLNPFNGNELPVFISDKVVFPPGRDTYIGIPSASMEDLKFSEVVGIPFQRHSIRSYEQQQNKISEILNKAREWKIGGYAVSSKLQDWLISRQRYWGTPIPIIHCKNCGAQPVPRDQLPVMLPEMAFSYTNKRSTLLSAQEWRNTSCPKCKAPAVREIDTMDTFVDSSWYFLRFIDPKNTKEMFCVDKSKKTFPVDLYVGGKEHAVLHLYYARFISHFLHLEGLLPCREPFKQLLIQGMIMGKTYKIESTGKYIKAEEVEETKESHICKETGEPVTVTWEKMSKSKHNGVDPLDLLHNHGVDTTRLLILGDVAPTSQRNWTTDTIPGIVNWQNRLWLSVSTFASFRNDITLEELKAEPTDPKYIEDDAYMFDSRNYFLKSVTFNITESQQLSVALSRMQGLTNSLRKVCQECMIKSLQYERALAVQIIMLAPLAPHFASELWAKYCSVKHHLIDKNEVDLNKNVLEQNWPTIDMDYKMVLKLHINGKEIMKIKVPKRTLETLSADAALDLVKNEPQVQKRLENKVIIDAKLLSKINYDSKLNIITRKCKETMTV